MTQPDSVLTFAYTYYDNPGMLSRHLHEWRKYPRGPLRRIRFLIVDDGSRKHPALPVVQAAMQEGGNTIDVALYRVLENKPWNQDGARNLAMKQCTTEWALLCDIDHLVTVDQLGPLLGLDFTRLRTAYMPNQMSTSGKPYHKPHPNIYVMRVEDFWDLGGYDEDFVGWYGSDHNFQRLMREWGIEQVFADHVYLTAFLSDDIADANTKDWGRKRSPYVLKLNKALIAKARGPKYKPENPIRFEWERQL